MKKNYDLDKEKIITLIFVLALSTSVFFVLILIPTLNYIMQQVLFYFGFFGIGFVILTILSYYLAKANDWLSKDNLRRITTIAIFLALSHASFIGLDNNSWYAFGGYLAGDLLIIFLGTFAYKKWDKKQNSKKPK